MSLLLCVPHVWTLQQQSEEVCLFWWLSAELSGWKCLTTVQLHKLPQKDTQVIIKNRQEAYFWWDWVGGLHCLAAVQTSQVKEWLLRLFIRARSEVSLCSCCLLKRFRGFFFRQRVFYKREGKRRPRPLDCVKFSPRKERDLFRLACNACWEILECVEWGTVVLLQLSDCMEQQWPNMSALLSEQLSLWSGDETTQNTGWWDRGICISLITQQHMKTHKANLFFVLSFFFLCNWFLWLCCSWVDVSLSRNMSAWCVF